MNGKGDVTFALMDNALSPLSMHFCISRALAVTTATVVTVCIVQASSGKPLSPHAPVTSA
jgi:hypothetical protein